jgi:phosphate transport system substrate-binding protein
MRFRRRSPSALFDLKGPLMRLRAIKSVVLALTMVASFVAAPAMASEVVNRGKCERRGEVVVGKDGFEYKCSIIGGGLKWVKGKKAASSGSTSSTSNDSKYANVSGKLTIDGSSTVAPLTTVAAEAFQKVSKTQITVGISGTGGGFTRFCKGETDVQNASRPISQKEIDACKAAGIEYTELRVATDALTVVINPRNSFASCLTTAELKKIWEPGSKIKYWNEVRSSFPKVKMALYGAGTDSGTFDYFTEAINGKAKASRTDYNPTEDDNVTVNGVKRASGGLGYYGLSYYLENTDINKAVQIDSGKGCVTPTAENALNGTYTPLARPLFIYVKNSAAKSNAALIPFLNYYDENLKALATKAKFIQLNPAQKADLDNKLAALRKLVS